MTTAIRLCGPDDAPQLLSLMARFHEEYGVRLDNDDRDVALAPLLEGSPYGAAYLLGPTKGPVGYTVITFGWSIEIGGMEAWVSEIFIRPNIRRRGIATEVLLALGRSLQSAGVRALHIAVDRTDPDTNRIYQKAGFIARERIGVLTHRLF